MTIVDADAVNVMSTSNAPKTLTTTARTLRRHLVTAMGISARMGAEQ